MASSSLRAIWVVLAALPLLSSRCYSADVVLIGSSDHSSAAQRELELATSFYGLNLKVVIPGSHGDTPAISKAVDQDATRAVAIAADALALVDENALLQHLKRRSGASVPLLIFGVTPETDATLLTAWSGGATTGCRRLEGPRSSRYIISHVTGLTRQLSGLELPFPENGTDYLVLGPSSKAQIITKAGNEGQAYPIFIEAALHEVKVFLECAVRTSDDAKAESNIKRLANEFLELAPAIMFVRYSAGDVGWHAPGHYANLTIDDPWLREPYGYLNYRDLLGEMEKHDFHTTIAFIPWNYDRSEPEVVSLVRDHPERFSICIHGDNHDHKEFTDYRSKPLADQLAALKQSLARMDRFKTLTGIPYDRVMVFPHTIAPEGTLEALKTYNYLATINSSNVPMDRPDPSLLPLDLRPVSVAFATFPSITRYPAELPVPSGFIEINAFLDNPLFFYGHHDLFASGIGAFDGVADAVNTLEPDTRWRGVGDIARHLYLVKLRDDSTSYDLLALSSNFDLTNPSQADSTFYVTKEETGRPAIASVSVDGRPCPYRFHGGHLDFSVTVPAGKARSVVIQYENDLELTALDISRKSVRVYLLRMASDFRDITLPRYGAGRALVRFYSRRGATSGQLLVYVSVLMVCCACGAWFVWLLIGRPARLKRVTTLT
jgi:hypothetical protein